MNKTIIGLIEPIKIAGGKKVLARIDTGAEDNSMCKELAEELNLGPIIKKIRIRSANGLEERPVVKTKIHLKGKNLEANFNLADRKKMKYKVLIGQKTLKKGFLIDPLL